MKGTALKPLPRDKYQPEKWKIGGTAEVSWNVWANHGGGCECRNSKLFLCRAFLWLRHILRGIIVTCAIGRFLSALPRCRANHGRLFPTAPVRLRAGQAAACSPERFAHPGAQACFRQHRHLPSFLHVVTDANSRQWVRPPLCLRPHQRRPWRPPAGEDARVTLQAAPRAHRL